MARIRSTHPGQWTDEAFATLSSLAHLLAIGLRNEADDGGIFEWRPVLLKMRLLPLYECDVAHLLAEIERNEIIRSYEADGKRYGAIRNFCRYQSPDKPREIYPRAEWVDAYVGKKQRAVADRSPTGSRPVSSASGGGPEQSGSRLNGASSAPLADPPSDGDPPPNGPGRGSQNQQVSGSSRPVADQSPTAPPRKGREGIGEEGNGVAPAAAGKRVPSLDQLDLDEDLLAVARVEGRDPGRELSAFKDHYRSKGKALKDWRAGFRNWLRSPYGDRPFRRSDQPHDDKQAKISTRADEARRWRAAEAQCRAEGENPMTAAGMARVAEILREQARAA